jgi:hypothetical protein
MEDVRDKSSVFTRLVFCFYFISKKRIVTFAVPD